MRVAMTGASGLIGSALRAQLESDGHEVLRLVRDRARTSAMSAYWSPSDGIVEVERLEGVDAVVHLAGRPIGSSRWTPKAKRAIRDSRIEGTRVLAEALAAMDDKPAVLLSASAIGWYGDRGDELLTEDSSRGSGFLSDVCREWEDEAQPAADAGIRVVHPRTGIVLTASGGALGRMLLPFRLGVGGRIGDGTQYMSWISLHDEVRALLHLLTSDLAGPVNLTGPEPVPNVEFTRALGAALRRPTVLPLPAAVVRLVFGEMGESLILEGQRVVPQRLLDDGFEFVHSDVDTALGWAVEH